MIRGWQFFLAKGYIVNIWGFEGWRGHCHEYRKPQTIYKTNGYSCVPVKFYLEKEEPGGSDSAAIIWP